MFFDELYDSLTDKESLVLFLNESVFSRHQLSLVNYLKTYRVT